MSGELVFDLNALFIYAKVVEHGGFAPAGRVLGIPKSTISRKVAQLEARLGVRLVQRSTRQFQVTEIGQAYYRHCVAMTVEAEAAEDVIEQNRSEPCGMVRLTCSTPLLHFELAPMLARFMAQYPNVELYVKTFNRRVDVIAEGYDISLSLRFPPLEERLSDRRPGRRVGAVAGSRRWTSRSRPAAGTRHRRRRPGCR